MLSGAETTNEKFMHHPLKKHVCYLRNQSQHSNNEDGENHKKITEQLKLLNWKTAHS